MRTPFRILKILPKSHIRIASKLAFRIQLRLETRPYFIDSERELEVNEYQALTAKEERDLESLMVKYSFAISNAEAFTEKLNRQLANIDATNVHAIMESEKKVEALMTMFDVSF